jgi:hypothetical protein
VRKERDGARPPSRSFVAIPDQMIDAVTALPCHQAWLLVLLVRDANWRPGVVDVRGQSIALDTGELLFSIDARAERHRMSSDQIRRALKTYKRLGIVTTRPATQAATGADTRPATQAATPPTIVRFDKWRDILWPPSPAATQAATGADTSPGERPAMILPVVPDLPVYMEKQNPAVPTARLPSTSRAVEKKSTGEALRPEQVACRQAISLRIDEVQQRRSGHAFQWSAAERKAIATLANLDGGKDPSEALRLIGIFEQRMESDHFYARNFRPTFIANQVNALRLPNTTATKKPRHQRNGAGSCSNWGARKT